MRKTGGSWTADSRIAGGISILTGLRWAREFNACRDAKLITHAIYVDRCGTVDPTNEITPEMCDRVVQNHGSLDDLEGQVPELVRWLGG